MATGTEALRKSTALVAGPPAARLWKKGRFKKKVMLEAVGAFTPREGPELLEALGLIRVHSCSLVANGFPRHAAPIPQHTHSSLDRTRGGTPSSVTVFVFRCERRVY